MAEERTTSGRVRGRADFRTAAAGPGEGHAAAVLDSGADEDPVIRHAALGEGLDPSFIAAWTELGFLDSEENRRLITADEAEAWAQAVLCARGNAGPANRDRSLADLFQDAASNLERLAGQTLRNGGDEEPALHLIETLLAADADDGGLTSTVVLSMLMRWLAAARESGSVDPAAVVDWVDRSLSRLPAAVAQSASGLIGHPFAPAETLAVVHVRLNPMFAPAMIWLAAGVAATAGGGDAHWLRQFDGWGS